MKKTLLPILGAFALCSVSHAATLVSFQFTTGTDVDEKIPFTTTGILDSDLTLSAGLSAAGDGTIARASTTSFASSFATNPIGAATIDLASAISNNVYFEFGLTPDIGFKIDLDGGNLAIRYNFSAGSATTRPNATALMFSATGFTSSDYAIVTGDPTNALLTYTISNSSLNDLTGDQTFRLYYWNTAGLGANTTGPSIAMNQTISGFNAGENVILTGTVAAVPEPTSLALMFCALGALGGLVLSRRRRNQA